MTDTQGTLEERLRRKRRVYNGRGTFREEIVNPDGHEAANEIASLRARVEVLEKLHCSNASTMEVTAMRIREWGKSCGELEYAINETRAALDAMGGREG